MNRPTTRAILVAGLLVAGPIGLGCKDDSGNGTGNPGTAGSGAAGTGGGGGATGTAGAGGTTGTGGTTPGFRSVAPCPNESDYVIGTTTVDFSSATVFAYSPKCLKVASGVSVTFTGDFLTHPLEPSLARGDQSGNPITSTSALPDGGTSKSFSFTTPGFFAYFCDVHGGSDSGAGMAGVVWVTTP